MTFLNIYSKILFIFYLRIQKGGTKNVSFNARFDSEFK